MPALHRGLAALLLLFAPGAAFAQSSAESRLREALRGATSQVHALEEENGKLQARAAALETELEKARAALESARRAAAEKPKARSPELATLQKQLGARGAEAEQAQAALAQCKAELDNEALVSRARERDREKAAQAEATAREGASQCEARATRLYQTASEGLRKLGDGGFCEPLFGFRRVDRENLAQQYQDRLAEQLQQRAAAAPAAAK